MSRCQRVNEGQHHRRLGQQKCAKADVSPLLAEKLPEFVFELGNKHVQLAFGEAGAFSPTQIKVFQCLRV